MITYRIISRTGNYTNYTNTLQKHIISLLRNHKWYYQHEIDFELLEIIYVYVEIIKCSKFKKIL